MTTRAALQAHPKTDKPCPSIQRPATSMVPQPAQGGRRSLVTGTGTGSHSRPQPSEAARTGNACHNCREKKVKCDGQWPCKYCNKRGLECLFTSTQKRKMFSVSEVRELKAKVARYEGNPSPRHTHHNTSREEDMQPVSQPDDHPIPLPPASPEASLSHQTNAGTSASPPSPIPSSQCPNQAANTETERRSPVTSPTSTRAMFYNGPGAAVAVVPRPSSSPSVHTMNGELKLSCFLYKHPPYRYTRC